MADPWSPPGVPGPDAQATEAIQINASKIKVLYIKCPVNLFIDFFIVIHPPCRK